MKSSRKKAKGANPRGKTAPPYPFEFKLRMVRLHLEEGYSVWLLSQKFNVSDYSIYRCSKLYRQDGEQALQATARGGPGPAGLGAAGKTALSVF